MAVVPRSLLTIGASLLSARAAMRLRRKRDSGAVQEKVFEQLIPKLAQGSAWKAAGVEPGMSYEAYREKVPLQTYEDLAPHIERMKKGAADVLWPGKCQIYSVSSGTSTGRAKHIPVTEPMLHHFKQCGLDSLLWYSARVGHAGVFRGRQLYLGGSTALVPIPESEPFEAYAGDLSGIAALNLPRWVERQFYEPGSEIAQIADWQSKIAAITERTAGIDISLLAGIPGWVLLLADSLRAHSRRGKARAQHLQGIWPNFECFIHGGVPVAPFQDELRAGLGPTVNFHEVYPSSEAFIAAQDSDAAAGLRLMANAGIFFEFIPMAEFEESRIPILGQKTVPLSGVEAGVDYALVITTPAGLARYVIGDVVRFVTTEPPRLVCVGRTRLQLNAFGEHVMEREITEALLTVCRRNGWTIVNFHVAPIFAGFNTGKSRGRHEWWVELKPGTLTTPTGPIMAVELDKELKRLNADYQAKRNAGALDAPFVRLVMPGVFEHWMRFHGKWGGHHKTPRCRSDRIIADELGQSLQFAKD
jgi:GH3 auxin-responsive promoter